MALPPRLPPRPATPAQVAQQVSENAQAPPQQVEKGLTDWTVTASTGSTLLDKAISGLKCKYGGLPGRMIVEISGPPGSGKTTIMAEILGSVQRLGGEIKIDDPEARLDEQYCHKMGVHLPMVKAKDKDGSDILIPDPEAYSQPDTVTDVIEGIVGPLETHGDKTRRNKAKAWCPDPGFINGRGTDSLASLSTRMEMEQGDKMGQRRAKELSEGMRVIARHIHHHNILLVFTNQLRDNVDGGQWAPKKITPGGNAIPYYSSVRIMLSSMGKLRKDNKSDPYGKMIKAEVSKNSKDIEWRSAPIYLIFGYGIDDIRANLQWLKDNGAFDEEVENPKTGKIEIKKASSYRVGDKKYISLALAVAAVEEQNLEQEIKDMVVDLWDILEAEKRPNRKDKVRG